VVDGADLMTTHHLENLLGVACSRDASWMSRGRKLVWNDANIGGDHTVGGHGAGARQAQALIRSAPSLPVTRIRFMSTSRSIPVRA